ncbi:uncharacterized protein LOC115882281 [Sitophilus oryzae]|uniref:Uncharacterized protein LOC115882281 n=1 Tax=Sitophilus oryzae TaxID=7048 RepID=A0A6J2XXB3_SITOR|nr:uncharacterized protein LOC115882281 [Sitophilus oryzae]
MVLTQQISCEEQQITNILVSIICLYGNDGLPMDRVEAEFQNYCGFPIPWRNFGAKSLRAWITTLPHIYIVTDRYNNEILIEHSPKSMHIKDLILKQKQAHYKPQNCFKKNYYANGNNEYEPQQYQMKHRLECQNLPEGSYIHTSINNVALNDAGRYEKFEELEAMLPLFYKHQALGDDFFLDIADSKLGYYVPDKGPKECGLCVAGQTISGLTERVKLAKNLAPRVVVMIGFQDLINGQNISTMITDLRQLVVELKKKNTRITLITLVPSPKLPKIRRLEIRMDIFNRAIIDYATDPVLKCNIIDMSTIFIKETEKFKKDFERFKKLTKSDSYKVFSDYGRKVFLNALKSCLKEQIEYGH